MMPLDANPHMAPGPAVRRSLGQVCFSGTVSGGRRQTSPGVNLPCLFSDFLSHTHTHTCLSALANPSKSQQIKYVDLIAR